MSHIIELTEKNFDHYFNHSELLVLYFWAEWCEPCHGAKRIFSEVVNTELTHTFLTQAELCKKSTICFGSINVDQEKNLVQDFTIRSVPTFAIIRNQVVIFIQSGTLSKTTLTDLIDQAASLTTEI